MSLTWNQIKSLSKMTVRELVIIAIAVLSWYVWFLTSESKEDLRAQIVSVNAQLKDAQTSSEVYRANHERIDRERDSACNQKLENKDVLFNEFVLKTVDRYEKALKAANEEIDRLQETVESRYHHK